MYIIIYISKYTEKKMKNNQHAHYTKVYALPYVFIWKNPVIL